MLGVYKYLTFYVLQQYIDSKYLLKNTESDEGHWMTETTPKVLHKSVKLTKILLKYLQNS